VNTTPVSQLCCAIFYTVLLTVTNDQIVIPCSRKREVKYGDFILTRFKCSLVKYHHVNKNGNEFDRVLISLHHEKLLVLGFSFRENNLYNLATFIYLNDNSQ